MQLPNFSEFENKINIYFKDKTLLKRAFAHRSFLNENKNIVPEHNERLEFLGDAVLELACSEFLYNKYPDKPEGELTALRAALVNTYSLAELARKLDMNSYLLLSKGEAKDTGRARQFILADAFEALLGAIYIDQGYKVVQDFLARHLFVKIDEIVDKRLWQDPKSRLQELAQDKLSVTPKYSIIKEEGPDHDKRFTSAVFFKDEQVAQGEGKSKQEAEQEAARSALDKLSW